MPRISLPELGRKAYVGADFSTEVTPYSWTGDLRGDPVILYKIGRRAFGASLGEFALAPGGPAAVKADFHAEAVP